MTLWIRILASVLMVLALSTAHVSTEAQPARCVPTPSLELGARAMQRAGSEGRLAEYLKIHGLLVPQFAVACGWSIEFASENASNDVLALLKLNRLKEVDEVSSAILAHYPARADTQELRARLYAFMVSSAIERRDSASVSERYAAYEAAIGKSPEPVDIRPLMDRIRRCRDHGDLALRCWAVDLRSGGTVLYGTFAYRSASGRLVHAEGQCPEDIDALPQAQLRPDGALRLIIRPGSALNASCRREQKIADLASNWWLAFERGRSEAWNLAPQLLEELRLWGDEIDGFDRDNPISRFQPRALAYFVRHSMLSFPADMQSASNRDRRMAWSAEQAQLKPYFDAAIPAIVDGQSGFLRTDNVGLAAFVAATAPWLGESRGEIVWRLVGTSFGDAGRSPPRSLAEVRAQLGEDELLVTTVHALDAKGAILAAGRSGDAWVGELDAGGTLAREIRQQLADSVAKPPDEQFRFPLRAAQLLYQQYICPGEKLRQTSARVPAVPGRKAGSNEPVSGRWKIAFVPDAVLERTPLSLLARPDRGCRAPAIPSDVAQLGQTGELGKVRWLGDDYSIRILPFEAAVRARPAGAKRAYVGIGAPVPRRVLRVSRDPLVRQSDYAASLPVLDGARAELLRVSGLAAFDGESVLMDERATEANLREELRRSPRILHFATHALDPAVSALVQEPLLVLTRSTGRFAPDSDGVLIGAEIRELHLAGTTAVLSACRTASAARGFGRGIFSGLVQAFFDAGAEQAVATYWPIDDLSSSQIVADMVESLAAGVDAADAIAAAQGRFRRAHGAPADRVLRHPYYWAAFVTVAPQPGSGRSFAQ